MKSASAKALANCRFCVHAAARSRSASVDFASIATVLFKIAIASSSLPWLMSRDACDSNCWTDDGELVGGFPPAAGAAGEAVIDGTAVEAAVAGAAVARESSALAASAEFLICWAW